MSAALPFAQDGSFKVKTLCRRYEGRVVIVTGASRGLGRVIARRVAEEGASVVITDLDGAAARRTAGLLEKETGSHFQWAEGDLSEAGVAEQVVAKAAAAFGRVDTLINNAAALIRMPLVDFTEELMQQAVRGNVWTLLRCCKAVLPQMIAQKYGRIVNIGGEAWRTGTPHHTLLGGIGKGGMVGLTATLAGDTAREGITVNCVSPAAMAAAGDGDPAATPSVRDPAWNPPAVLAGLAKMAMPATFIGRAAHLTEVAAAVAFFGSPEASYVTGQHLGVSGGLVMI